MTQIWRKPGVLMAAYFALFVGAEAWAATRFSISPSEPQAPDMGSALIAAFLAWRVTRGGSISRVLIIVFTVGVVQKLLWGADLTSGGLVSLGLLVICLAEIALLISTPVYERTRNDWTDRPPSTAPLWPLPRWWMAAVAVAAGLLVTLLFLGSEDLRPVPCASTSPSPGHCVALAQGFPVHFLSAAPDGSFSAPIIDRGAAAEDLAVWTVLSFAACYLIWLPSKREAPMATAPVAAGV